MAALLAAGADVSRLSPDGNSALAFAAKDGHLETVKLLLAKGADPHLCRAPAFVPLAIAAAGGNADVVKAMLDAGARVDATNQAGFTALHTAAATGQTAIAMLLIGRGADVAARAGEGGVTPAVSAAFEGHLETLKALVGKGADLRFHNGDFSMIGVAAENGRSDVVRYLVEQGIDPNTRSQFQDSPLSYACGHGDAELMRFLIDRGARMFRADQGLAKSIEAGHADCARLALSRGARLSEDDQVSLTESVLRRGDCETATVLLDTGRWLRGLPPAPDAEQDLLRAAFAGDVPKLRRITAEHKIDNPAAVEAAVALAKHQNHAEAAAALEQAVGEVLAAANRRVAAGRALIKAAEAGDAKAAAKALADGAAPDFREMGLGVDAMTEAIGRNHLDIVKLLIDGGYPLNVATGPVSTPLRRGSERGSAELVKLLLESGADPNLVSDRFAPLESYAFNGHTECVRLLLVAGAKINYRGYMGGTALTWAAERGHVETVRLLLARRAKTGLTNDDGATALDVARSNGHDEVVKALRAAGARAALGADRPPALIDNMERGPEVLQRLIDDGADPNQPDAKWGRTPLAHAVSFPFRDDVALGVVKVLLENGVDPAEYPGIVTDAVSGQAIRKDGGLPVIKLLLDRHADVNAVGNWAGHYTALHRAAELGRVDVVELLVRTGAKLDARVDSGERPIDLAERNHHAAAVEFLRKVESRSPAGATPK